MGKNAYKGKYFSVLGDSVSTLAGYHPPECGVFYDWKMKRLAGISVPEDTWWGRVIADLEGKLLVNHSWAGSTVCRLPGCEVQSYGCSNERTGALGTEGRLPDVVMIFMGLNDLGFGMSLAPDGDSLTAFPVAYSVMLKNIQRHYPGAEIWCLTLPQIPGIGERARKFNQVIRYCADENGCRCVDIYRTDAVCDTMGDYHPTVQGMQSIARLVMEEIKTGGSH